MFGRKKDRREPVPPHPRQEPRIDGPLTAENLERAFGGCVDFAKRPAALGGDPERTATLCYLSGMVKMERISDYILRPLAQDEALARCDEAQAVERIKAGALYNLMVEERTTADQGAFDLINGWCLLFFPKTGRALSFLVQTEEKRSISPSENEPPLKGPRDAFVESVRTNTSILRRRVRTPALRIQEQMVGRQTVTPVDVVWIEGIADPATQAALFADPQPVPSWATPRPTATPAPMPYLLEVDLTNQITTAYGLDEAGQYTLVVRRMICSTGTSSYPTPVETVEMPAKRARWGYFPQWDSHAQYLTRIDSLNAFHSVLYYSPNEDDLAVSSYEALGTPASHGCVRLLVADAKWIYDNCQAGTIIRIFEGEPDPELTESLKPPPLDYGTMLPAVTPQPTAEPVYDGVNFPAYSGILKRGTESEAVYFLQRRLQELGYYHGTVTGGYYGGTIEAVEAFQRDHGLSVDGVAGQQTLALLYSPDLSPSAVPTVSPAPTASPALTPTPSPAPTAVRTPEPDAFFVTATPGPTPAPTAIPTATPVPTATAIPTATPSPTLIPPDAPFSGNAVG